MINESALGGGGKGGVLHITSRQKERRDGMSTSGKTGCSQWGVPALALKEEGGPPFLTTKRRGIRNKNSWGSSSRPRGKEEGEVRLTTFSQWKKGGGGGGGGHVTSAATSKFGGWVFHL